MCLVIPPLLIVLLTPVLWHDPIGGMMRALAFARDNPWTIASYYLGEATTERLSGISGLVILAITTPITWGILAVLGGISGFRHPAMWAFALPLIALLGARVTGLLPTHDVERQYLPVWYDLAGLVGLGANAIHLWISRRFHAIALCRAAVSLVAIGLLVEPVSEAWCYRAHGLSYFNQFVGGLPGAERMGFEISYWYEAATDAVWHDMLDDLPANSRIFMRPDHPGLDDLRRWGVWRGDLQVVGPREATQQILYAKRAAYWIPEGIDGELVPTDLGVIAEQGAMEKEVRFLDVRLMGRRSVGVGR